MIVGEITHRLTRAAVEYVELAPLELKGKAELVPAWEAVRAVVRGRAARSSATTPLVGRSDETERLLALFDRVISESRPHLVTVIGPAGVGKSRLLRELTLEIGGRPSPPAVRLGSCPAYGAGLAYWALGEIVRGTFDIVDTDDAGAAWRKLKGGIEDLLTDSEVEEPADRVAAALGRPLGIEPAPARRSSAPTRTRSRCASGSSRRSGSWSRPAAGANRCSSPSRTSTGPTRACSI